MASSTPRLGGTEFTELALHKFEEIHRAQPFHLVHSIDSSGCSSAAIAGASAWR